MSPDETATTPQQPRDPAPFQFEHLCPDRKTVVLSDSPDGIGSHIYAPHLAGRLPGYERVMTWEEFGQRLPSALVAPAIAPDVDAGANEVVPAPIAAVTIESIPEPEE